MKAETRQRGEQDEFAPSNLDEEEALDGDGGLGAETGEDENGVEFDVGRDGILNAELLIGPLSTPRSLSPGAATRTRPLVQLRAGLVRRLQTVAGRLPHVDERLARALLSLLLAALLWFYVGSLENPDRTTVYTDLAIEYRGLGPNLKVISLPQDVSATIQAPQAILATLSQADVRAYIDLAGLGPGVHPVPVRADTRETIPGGSNSVTLSPDTMQVQIEEEVTREFPIVVRLIGTPAFGYGSESPQFTPSNIVIRGVPDAVSRVTEVVVNIDVEDKAGTQQGMRPPLALAEGGTPIDNITFEPASVEVVVPIKLLVNYKVVPVRVPVPGQPATGYRVSAITYDPTNVTVCCEPEILEQLQYLDTLPVNISGTTSTVISNTSLILPPSVEVFPGQPRTISVTVSIEAIVTTLQLSVAPTIEGEQEGLDIVLSPDRLDLLLEGTFDQLQGLTPTDIGATINLQQRGPGTYDLRPQIVVPTGVTLASASPKTISVTVIAPTPSPTLTAIPPTPVPTGTPLPATPIPTTIPVPSTTIVPTATTAITPTGVVAQLPTGTPIRTIAVTPPSPTAPPPTSTPVSATPTSGTNPLP